jgi:hypothetical protein
MNKVPIVTLIALVIKLVLIGVETTKAVSQISSEYGVSFDELWRELPSSFK